MGGREQFFRIGAGCAALVLEARLERIGRRFQRAALGVDRTGAVGQGAFPDSECMAFHERFLVFAGDDTTKCATDAHVPPGPFRTLRHPGQGAGL